MTSAVGAERVIKKQNQGQQLRWTQDYDAFTLKQRMSEATLIKLPKLPIGLQRWHYTEKNIYLSVTVHQQLACRYSGNNGLIVRDQANITTSERENG